MKHRLILLITLLTLSIGASAQSWTNFNSYGVQRKIVGSDTSYRIIGSSGMGLPFEVTKVFASKAELATALSAYYTKTKVDSILNANYYSKTVSDGRFLKYIDPEINTPKINMGDTSRMITLYVKGTSVTAGTTNVVGERFLSYLHQAGRILGVKTVNYGLGGRFLSNATGVSGYATRYDVPEYKTGDYYGIELFANDTRGDSTVYNPTTYSIRLDSMRVALNKSGWPNNHIIVLNPAYYKATPASAVYPNGEYRHHLFSNAAQALATSTGMLFYDNYDNFKVKFLLDNSLLDLAPSDTVHPTQKGHNVAAEDFSNFMLAYINTLDTDTSILRTVGAADIYGDLNVGGNLNTSGIVNAPDVNSDYTTVRKIFTTPIGLFPSGTSSTKVDATGLTVNNMLTLLTLNAYRNVATTTPYIRFGKSNTNTIGSKVATTSGHWLGLIDFYGTGTAGSDALGARIQAVQDGPVSTSYSPAAIILSNYNLAGVFTERIRIASGNGSIGMGGVTSPTAKVHIGAGSTAAGTAPQKYTSGPLMTTAEAGAQEFLTDKFYATITTGAARKEYTLNDIGLNSGIVPVTTTNGRLTNSTVTPTELGYLSGVTGGIQAQLNAKGSGTVTSITPGIGFNSPTPITTSGTINLDTVTAVSGIARKGFVINYANSLVTNKVNLSGGNTISGIQNYDSDAIWSSGTSRTLVSPGQVGVYTSPAGAETFMWEDRMTFKRNSGSLITTLQAQSGAGSNNLLLPDTGGTLPALSSGTPPASSSSTGKAGTIIISGGFMYVCTATDTWIRAAVTTSF